MSTCLDTAKWRIHYSDVLATRSFVFGADIQHRVFDDMEYLIDKYATFPGRHGNGPGP